MLSGRTSRRTRAGSSAPSEGGGGYASYVDCIGSSSGVAVAQLQVHEGRIELEMARAALLPTTYSIVINDTSGSEVGNIMH